jgi:DNA-binding MarR family transcriptional regulator
MDHTSLTVHSDELTAILRRLIFLRRRLKFSLPDHLVGVKAHLEAARREGRINNLTDYYLLHNIGAILSRQQEPITMGELSRKLDVPLSTATRIVDWLVKSEYVVRLPDPEDRRVVRVALTQSGQEIYRASDEFIHRRVEKLLQNFTAEESERLVALLSKLVDILEKEEPT